MRLRKLTILDHKLYYKIWAVFLVQNLIKPFEHEHIYKFHTIFTSLKCFKVTSLYKFDTIFTSYTTLQVTVFTSVKCFSWSDRGVAHQQGGEGGCADAAALRVDPRLVAEAVARRRQPHAWQFHRKGLFIMK